jgi:hypothetical protein
MNKNLKDRLAHCLKQRKKMQHGIWDRVLTPKKLQALWAIWILNKFAIV